MYTQAMDTMAKEAKVQAVQSPDEQAREAAFEARIAAGEFIEAKHLPPALIDAGRTEPTHRTLALAPGTTVEEAERQLIMLTLEHTRDNKTRAAEILGFSLKTLHNKLNKLKLRGDDEDQD